MKFKIEFSKAYKKSYKRAEKRGLDMNKLDDVVKIIANGGNLPEIYKDHSLSGKYKNCRECHILPDWLLIYRKLENVLILYLIETGTHSDLFELEFEKRLNFLNQLIFKTLPAAAASQALPVQ